MQCPKCGGDTWDNREGKKNPKAPDYKCKDKSCDGVIWPPRGGGSRPAAAPRSAPPATRGNDDRSNRIERQHSQEMAIRWFALTTITEPLTTEKLRSVIDWFQRDVGNMPTAPISKSQEPNEGAEGDPSEYGDGSPDEEPF